MGAQGDRAADASADRRSRGESKAAVCAAVAAVVGVFVVLRGVPKPQWAACDADIIFAAVYRSTHFGSSSGVFLRESGTR